MALKLSLPRVQGEKGGGDEGVECMKMDSVPSEECGGEGSQLGVSRTHLMDLLLLCF